MLKDNNQHSASGVTSAGAHSITQPAFYTMYITVICNIYVTYDICNMVRQMVGKDIEVAWEELKEGILRSAVEVCGESRARRERRRTAWWSKEVQEAVRAKKLAYRKLLNQGSEEARLAYNEAKKEAKVRVRKQKK